MMARGRKAVPAAVKQLRGNPGKRKLSVDTAPLAGGEPIRDTAKPGQPIMRLAVPSPPSGLSKLAKDEWNRLAADLVRLGLLRRLDTGAFAARCELYATWTKCQQIIQKKGMTYEINGLLKKRPEVQIAQECMRQIRSYDSEFGLTPAARARVSHVTAGHEQPSLPGMDQESEKKSAEERDTAPTIPGVPVINEMTDDDFFRGPPTGRPN